VPGFGVSEDVDVSVLRQEELGLLVRAHAVALKDGGKNVVLRVEAIVAPEGVDSQERPWQKKCDEGCRRC
jgi:hypothetical protein